MARWAVLVVLVGCGRVGFDEQRVVVDGPDGDAPNASGFSALVAYGDQTCATYEGKLYCWGDNGAGQLGDGTTDDASLPTAVNVPAGSVTDLAQGETHGCAVIGETLYCWGEGFDVAPAKVVFSAPVKAVDAGRDFTCALAERLYCWGDNSLGQLGDGTMVPRLVPTPVAIAGTVTGFDAGDDHVCAISNLGVSCWGHNDHGTLGTGSFNPDVEPTPVTVPGVSTLPRIAGWHACSLDNGVRCWGRNVEGELGDGTNDDSASPVLAVLPTTGVLATGGGPADRDASCAATGSAVRCWGSGVFGRLGNGQTADQSTAVNVVGLPDVTVRGLALGYAHTCALTADGEIWCWGRGDAGQLGHGAFADSLVPVRVTPPSS